MTTVHMRKEIVNNMPEKKIYNFTFEPFTLFRVFWDEKNYRAIIQFDRSSLYKTLEPGEKNNYFEQLIEYCRKSKIGVEVHPYEEN